MHSRIKLHLKGDYFQGDSLPDLCKREWYVFMYHGIWDVGSDQCRLVEECRHGYISFVRITGMVL